MFSIIRTGLDAANRDLAVISNNIANAGTNGFKKSEAMFEDLYHSQHNNSTEPARGMGVKTIKPRQSFAQGSLQATNGSLDLAIMGEGFFVLGQPLGRQATAINERAQFTRDGSFQLDRLGNLVNTDGLPLLGLGQTPINIPFIKEIIDGDNTRQVLLSEISVNSEGEIINHIHSTQNDYDGLIINPAAFTHTSIAIRDALLSVKVKFIEVHLSNIHARETFRHTSLISAIAKGVIAGFGATSYYMAIDAISHLHLET